MQTNIDAVTLVYSGSYFTGSAICTIEYNGFGLGDCAVRVQQLLALPDLGKMPKPRTRFYSG
jgi:hypothetical protein